MEIWKDIPGYDGKYQASSLGRVRNRKGRILRQSIDPKNTVGESEKCSTY